MEMVINDTEYVEDVWSPNVGWGRYVPPFGRDLVNVTIQPAPHSTDGLDLFSTFIDRIFELPPGDFPGF